MGGHERTQRYALKEWEWKMCSEWQEVTEVEGTVRNIEAFEQVDMYVMEK